VKGLLDGLLTAAELPLEEAPIIAPAVIFFWVSFSPQWGHTGTLSASEKRISLSKISPQLGH
jgi:hypothetical protein